MKANAAEEHSGDRRLVDRDLFRDVIGHFTSGVTAAERTVGRLTNEELDERGA